MKKINVLILSVLTLFLVNCSDDDESNSVDDESNETEIDFSGKWIGTMFLIDEPFDFNNDGIEGTDYKVELPCLIQDITLNLDGTGLFEANIHSRLDDVTLACVEFQQTSLTWELNDDRTKILLSIFDGIFEIVIADENTIERFSEALLDEDIGIPGKVVYERE